MTVTLKQLKVGSATITASYPGVPDLVITDTVSAPVVRSGAADTRWTPKFDLPSGMAINPSTGRVEGAPVAWQYNTTRAGTSETLASNATLADLQTALNNAPKKHTIYVDPASLFLGTLVTPVRDGTWTMDDSTYIETVGFRSLVADGHRVTSGQFGTAGNAMARLYGNSNLDDIVTTGGLGAGFVRFVGIEFGFADGINVGVAPNGYASSEGIGVNTDACVILDRCYYGRNTAWNIGIFFPSYGTDTAMVDSHIENVGDVSVYGRESKCVYFNGIRGFVLRNNYLDADAINVMIGAGQATPSGQWATDVLVEWNYLTKQDRYSVNRIKNLFEIKMTDRALVRYNYAEHNAYGWQQGVAISFKASAWWHDSSSDPVCRNVHFVFNWVDDVPGMFKIAGQPEQIEDPPNSGIFYDGVALEPACRIEVAYNIGTRINTGPFCQKNPQLMRASSLLPKDQSDGTHSHDWQIHHNLLVNDGANGATNGGFCDQEPQATAAPHGWDYNIQGQGQYNNKGAGVAAGNATLADWPGYSFLKNALVDTFGYGNQVFPDSSTSAGTTAGSIYVDQATGFAGILTGYTDGDPLTNDFRVKPSLASTPAWQDADGFVIGPDMDVLEAVRDYRDQAAVPAGY